MPTIWESPQPLDVGPAEALACFVQSKAGAYTDRSINKPAQELEQADADDDWVIAWWVLVKRAWTDYQKRDAACPREADGSLKCGVKYPIWVPSVMFFGEKICKQIQEYGSAYNCGAENIEEFEAARTELQALVGFTTYAYYKHELRAAQ